MAINRYRLKNRADNGDKRAKLILNLLERPDRLIGLILLGNNFINILASAIVTVIATRLYGDGAIPIAAGILTLFLLIFSEVLPKTLAATKPEFLAYPASPALKVLSFFFMPLVALINLITNSILKMLGLYNSRNEDGEALSSSELRTLVLESKSMMPRQHHHMLMSILDLEALSVEDIMIPRTDIGGIDLEDEWDEVLNDIRKTPYSRLVVFNGDLNETVGILRMRSLAGHAYVAEELNHDSLLSLLEEPYYIPEGTALQTQLVNFQQNRHRFGLVVDEYGDIVGAVTMEAILEEIVGKFTSDPIHTLRSRISKSNADNSYTVDAGMSIRVINRALNLDLPVEDARTLNGLVLQQFEDIPSDGDIATINDHQFEILRVDGRRVISLKIRPNHPATHEPALDEPHQ